MEELLKKVTPAYDFFNKLAKELVRKIPESDLTKSVLTVTTALYDLKTKLENDIALNDEIAKLLPKA